MTGSRSAITLAEVCVVGAILGVLAALLVPAAQTALNAARRTACAGNLRQVGLAFLVYAEEHDGHLPADSDFGEDPDTSPAWFDRLPGYLDGDDLRRMRVFQCAGYKAPERGRFFERVSPKSLKMNGYLDDDGRPRHCRPASLPDADAVLLLVDAVAGETGMGQWGRAVRSAVDPARHPPKANWLALDGHAVTATREPPGRDWARALPWTSSDWAR